MDELDPKHRALVDAFRAQQGPAAGFDTQVWSRLETSLGSGFPDAPTTLGRRVVEWVGAKTVALVVGMGALGLAWAFVSGRAPGGGVHSEASPHGIAPPEPSAASVQAVEDSVASTTERESAVEPEPELTPESTARSPVAEPESEPESEPEPVRRRRRRPATTSTVDSTVREFKAHSQVTELALLARAKRLLSAGDATQALAVLRTQRERFGQGQLLEENALLRVRALCALGRRAKVAELKLRFASRHPGSPLAQQVRSSCSE